MSDDDLESRLHDWGDQRRAEAPRVSIPPPPPSRRPVILSVAAAVAVVVAVAITVAIVRGRGNTAPAAGPSTSVTSTARPSPSTSAGPSATPMFTARSGSVHDLVLHDGDTVTGGRRRGPPRQTGPVLCRPCRDRTGRPVCLLPARGRRLRCRRPHAGRPRDQGRRGARPGNAHRHLPQWHADRHQADARRRRSVARRAAHGPAVHATGRRLAASGAGREHRGRPGRAIQACTPRKHHQARAAAAVQRSDRLRADRRRSGAGD